MEREEEKQWLFQKIINFFCSASKKKDSLGGDPITNQMQYLQKQAENVLLRDKTYARVLEDYAKHQNKINRNQRIYKTIFFTIVCASYVFIVLGSIYAIVLIAQKDGISWTDFALAITSVVSLVSVIIVLPSKIAEHLFPNQGEKGIMDFVTKMHEMDTQSSENLYSKKLAETEIQDDAMFAKSIKERGACISKMKDSGQITDGNPDKEKVGIN